MKQWFDAVFEYGWAYGSTGTALQGKEVMLVASFGASAADYQLEGRFQVTVEELLKPITTIQFLTGLSFSEPFIITASLNTSDKDITEQAQAFLARLSEK
ncbi:NAD(P)H-dependent oxidoreductase [Streptococcus suis]|nr:NAD(P)H-dependent oxidoreductase [Streptococcus suis]